jgi:hypothetical protein
MNGNAEAFLIVEEINSWWWVEACGEGESVSG